MTTEHFPTGSHGANYRESMQQRMPESLSRSYQSFEECVAHYPAVSVMASFVGGLTLGMLLGYSMVEPERRRRSANRQWIEQFGRRVLEAVRENLPESMSEQASRRRS